MGLHVGCNTCIASTVQVMVVHGLVVHSVSVSVIIISITSDCVVPKDYFWLNLQRGP